MALFVPAARAAELKSFQSGITTVADTTSATTITLSPTVDTTKAFLVFGVSEDTSLPIDGQISGQITSSATDPACPATMTCATFQRVGTTGAVTVKWYVVEFVSGVSVQRGAIPPCPAAPPCMDDLSNPADVDVPIGVVDRTKSFPLITLRTTGVDYDSGDFYRAKLTTDTNLRIITPDAGGAVTVEWQVVEYQDARVQTGDLSFANTDLSLTATLAPAVNTAKSWLIYDYECAPFFCNGDLANMGSKLMRGVVTDGTTLTFDRDNTGLAGESINLTWHLVEFTDGTTVQSGSEPFTTSETQRDVTLATPATGGTSIAVGGGAYLRGGRSEYNVDDVAGVGLFTFDLTSPTNLQITRGTAGPTTPATADAGWFVVTFQVITTEVRLQSFAAKGADGAVDLAWTTSSELTNLGFNLYRSRSPSGPFARITSSLIPGLGSSPTGATYSYRDPDLVNGETYFYELEDVETAGKTALHGPVSATPSAPGTDSGGGSGNSGSGSGGGSAPGSGPLARITYGDPEAVSFRVVERGSSHALLELLTPGFYGIVEGEGTVRLEVPGFESRSVPGAPAVPVKRAFVEALAGRRAHLGSIVPSDYVRFDGVRVGAAEAPSLVVTDQGMVKAGLMKAAGVAPRGLFPRRWAQVLEASFQGETKKARVELAPLRHDPVTGTTILARRLLVRVEFSGLEGGERVRSGSRGRRALPVPRLRSGGLVAELVTPDAGLYAVRYEDVFRRGRGVLASSLGLSRQGQSVAYHLEPQRALFGPGSVLYFVSVGSESNPWGSAVYQLATSEKATRMSVVTGTASGAAAMEYLDRKDWEQNRYYQAGLLEAKDLWQWDLLVSPVTKSYPITLRELSQGSTPAHLTVWLQGASDFEVAPDHHLRVSVNGQVVGEASWGARTERVIEADVLPGILVEGQNTVSLENVGDTAASYSMVFLNRFSLSYPRKLVAEGGSLQGTFEESGMAQVAGLGPGYVLDTQDEHPTWLAGVTTTAGDLSFRAEAGRRYLAVSTGAVKTALVRRPVASSLRSTANRADWLLVAPKELLGVAQPLVDLRKRQGLRVKAVSLEQVYREFGFGEESPQALKAFLGHAYQNWRRPSFKYVVLLGDGSYDPKDYLKTGVKNQIPPLIVKTSYLWTASDPGYASLNGEDQLPDVALGRLAAGSVDEARILVEKVVTFETARRTPGGKAVLIADNADRGGGFEADADALASGVLAGREVEKVYLRDLGSGMRATIRAAFDNAPGLVSYVGHGGTAVWASENVFNNTDVASLSAQGQQPLLLTMNCLNGFFHFPPFNSLAEAFVKAEGKGAIAAFSPSGLSVNEAAHVYHQALLEAIESGVHPRLGDAILAAQSSYADSGAMPELLSIYHLLGDPALKLR